MRACWSKQAYLSGREDPKGHKRPFLVEDCSKAHVERISGVMASSYDWAVIAAIAHISDDAERLGKWAENCPCHRSHDGGPCALKGCRAPEMASGQTMIHQCGMMLQGNKLFPAYLAKAPAGKQAELSGAWSTSRSKLFGF